MPKGKPWSEAENKLLLEMAKKGMSVQQICDSGKFPNRTYKAIEHQLKRLGSYGTRKEKFYGTQISKAEIPDFDDVLARYVDAFNQICEKKEYTKEELERFRIIFMAAWKYRELFREYEAWEEVKKDVEWLKTQVAEILAKKAGKKRH